MAMTLLQKIDWYLKNRGWRALFHKGTDVYRDVCWYLRHKGVRALLKKGGQVWRGEGGTFRGAAIAQVISQSIGRDELLDRVFFRQRPLGTFPAQPGAKQVVMVTDSIGKGSLFGGVATSIILSALVAKKAGLPLRIVTREERAVEENIGIILKNAGVSFDGDVHFSYVSVHDHLAKVGIGQDDIIITTSWWTTESVKNALGTRNLFYLLQEDERMFYPLGDEHLRCSELLADPSITVMVNSRLLFEHLSQSGLSDLASRGVWFEPAFPHALKTLPEGGAKEKGDFFFYARPGHARNLFCRGIDVVQTAIDRGVLKPDAWNLHFVGVSMPNLSLGEGVSVKTYSTLGWAGYLALMKRMDLGLSLMYTPHPSYPPLDLAASGAVAVTNRCGLKQSLDHYSRNIICADVDVESLLKGLAEGVELSQNRSRRAQNLAEAGLATNWEHTLDKVVDFILARRA